MASGRVEPQVLNLHPASGLDNDMMVTHKKINCCLFIGVQDRVVKVSANVFCGQFTVELEAHEQGRANGWSTGSPLWGDRCHGLQLHFRCIGRRGLGSVRLINLKLTIAVVVVHLLG